MTIEILILFLAMLLLAIVIGLIIGTAIVYLRDRRPRVQERVSVDTTPCYGRWYIELWDIGRGCRYATVFDGGVTLGREIPESERYGRLSIGQDETISREQCLIYEQDGWLQLWNLSKVNPTLVNGIFMNQPRMLQVGDRITMGGHVFLLTSLVRA